MQLRKFGGNNHILYNIYGLAEFSLFMWLYYHLLNTQNSKKLIIVLVSISLASILINGVCISEPFFIRYLSYAFSFMSLVLTVVIMLFLFQIVRSDKVLYLNEIFAFWMSMGLLFFQVGHLPFKVFSNHLLPGQFLDIIYLIQTFCNLLMYGSFIIGFLISKREFNFI